MFGKRKIKTGDHVFVSKTNSTDAQDILFGIVTGTDGKKIGIDGLIINPIGLKNKILQGKAGPRSTEVLKHPTPNNCILAFIYRIEYETYTNTLNVDDNEIELISPRVYSILDGWIRESLSELINNVLSLPENNEKEKAKYVLKQRMDTLYDKNLKRNLYSVCRSLKILT